MDFGVSIITNAADYFWRPEQTWVFVAALVLWGLLRRTLPEGSQYVLKQTFVFFILCLLGEVGASLMRAIGWTQVASGLFEVAQIGVGIALIRAAGMLLFRVFMPAVGMETPRILEDIAVIVGYCVWGMIRLRYAGLELGHLVATSAVITAVVAFAMQDTLGNILGGLAIHLDHSVEIGDWVIVDNVSGRVIDIRWRYTKIATRNGEKVVIPNSQLMKNKFSVVGIYGSKTNAWRRWVWFNVPLEHPPAKVIEALERMFAEAEIPNVAREPRPNGVLMEFGPGYGRYALRYWLTDPQVDDPTDSAVRMHVFAALERAGMQLAIPEEARHIIKENEAHQQALAAREMRRRLDALVQVELFHGLSPEELSALAGHLAHAPFAKGDTITRQGATAHWLYVLVSGEAEVWLETQGSERRLMTTLQPGCVFGEMGMMTGEPRRATVIAKTDVECYRLDKEGFEATLQGRPAIAEGISRVLAARDAELDKARQDMNDVVDANRRSSRDENILNRIREFFRLPG
ncbi:MAG: mechanosensitive ion channel [Rhodocyclaceae bacterium]|nr:mechanosensitive ion channel [Rhodocyclaceae bacterium]